MDRRSYLRKLFFSLLGGQFLINLNGNEPYSVIIKVPMYSTVNPNVELNQIKHTFVNDTIKNINSEFRRQSKILSVHKYDDQDQYVWRYTFDSPSSYRQWSQIVYTECIDIQKAEKLGFKETIDKPTGLFS